VQTEVRPGFLFPVKAAVIPENPGILKA